MYTVLCIIQFRLPGGNEISHRTWPECQWTTKYHLRIDGQQRHLAAAA
jgi:hypothetical protein